MNQVSSSHKRAIHVLSIGNDRTWFRNLQPYVEAYSSKCEAEFHPIVAAQLPVELQSQLRAFDTGVTRVKLLISKLLSVRNLLKNFDQVLLLDDTCCVSPSTPNLFELHVHGTISAVRDGGALGREDNDTINTGVVVLDSTSRPLLADLEILFEEYKTRSGILQDQTLLNHARVEGRFKVNYLDNRFNVVGSQISEERMKRSEDFIFHLTSSLNRNSRVWFSELFRATHSV